MEITDIRCVEYAGTFAEDADVAFYEERLAWPLDVYEEFRTTGAEEAYLENRDVGTFPYLDDGRVGIDQAFLEVETDEGITGLSGPIDRVVAHLALDVADPLLVGRDPRATEKLWDLMYRQEVHGRKGKTMMAISAVDCALWDLTGKYYDEPVHRLLGGPTREELTAYASMLGYPVEPAAAAERAAEFVEEKGFEHQKWFFRHGPGSGTEGVRENVALVASLREAVGEDVDLMFDCWMSWDLPYARDMIPRLAPYEPRWVEEPLRPDEIDGHAALAAEAPFPIAGGEHEYTRWGIHELLDRDALDVLQPDTYWAGGITELQKIATLGSVHDVPVIPHGHSVPANVQIVAANPPTTCPLVEYLWKWNQAIQFFFEEPLVPEDGVVEVPAEPGLGIAIDESKVEAARVLEF